MYDPTTATSVILDPQVVGLVIGGEILILAILGAIWVRFLLRGF